MRTGPLGEQHRVRLVLDVVLAVEVELPAGVLVDDETPELRHHLCVGLVATEDLQAQRALVVGGEHQCRSCGLFGCEVHIASGDAELVERGRDLSGGRAPTRRPEDQMDHRGDAPAEEDRGEEIIRIPRAEVHRGDGDQEHEHLPQPARRSGDIRPCHRDDCDDHREACEREVRAVVAEADDGVEALADALVLRDERAHPAGDRPCGNARDPHVAREPPASGKQRGRYDEPDGPQCADRIEQPEQ